MRPPLLLKRPETNDPPEFRWHRSDWMAPVGPRLINRSLSQDT